MFWTVTAQALSKMLGPASVVGAYLLVGILWNRLTEHPTDIFFLIGSAGLIYLLMRYSAALLQEETLRKAGEELQTRVQERTAELTETNQALRQEVAKRRESEEVLHRQAERLEILRKIDLGILSHTSPQEIAQATVAHVQDLIPCQRVCVVLFELEKEEALLLAVEGRGEKQLGSGSRLSLDAFGNRDALQEGKHQEIEDLSSLAEPPLALKILRDAGLRSLIHIPLIAHDRLIGALSIGFDRPEVLLKEYRDLARHVADQLAIVIHNACLHERNRHRVGELERRVAERTADLKTLIYSLTHDLRQPLEVLQGLTQALQEDFAHHLPPDGQDYLHRISMGLQKLDDLIEDLLTYGRLSGADLPVQPLGLSALVAEVQDRLATELRGKTAQINVEEPLPEVIGHPPTLIQILINLLTNAVKFVAPGVHPRIQIWAEAKNHHVRLWIEDNGLGITPEDQQRIFEVFERLHGEDTYPGTGMGLAIVRRGVERLGGRVGVESQLDQGSRFWIELPAVSGKPHD